MGFRASSTRHPAEDACGPAGHSSAFRGESRHGFPLPPETPAASSKTSGSPPEIVRIPTESGARPAENRNRAPCGGSGSARGEPREPLGGTRTFRPQFELDGYLAINERGERVLDELARDMFSLSLSEGAPSRELWGRRFGQIRMNLRVEPFFDRCELRRVTYAGEDVQDDHPFKKLREVGLRRFGKNVIPQKLNRAGAFFLPLRYSKQQEVRLLVKRVPGSLAVDTRVVNGEEVLPISLEQDHGRVSIQLAGVQVASEEFVAPVQQVLAAVPHRGVGVQVVQQDA